MNTKELSVLISGIVMLVLVTSAIFVYAQITKLEPNSLYVDGGALLEGVTLPGNGLLVANGRIGFGTVNPTEFLDVQGGDPRFTGGSDFIFNDSSNPNVLTVPTEIETTKLEVTTIVHEEQGVDTQYLFGSDNCFSCGITHESSHSLPERIAHLFTVNPALAAPECYDYCSPQDAPACSTIGAGWTEISQDVSTVIENVCGIGPGGCLDPENPVNYGSYVWRRLCQGPAGPLAEATKLEFLYDSGLGENTTIINDNLQSPSNVRESCGWETGDTCGSDRFQAGYDDVDDEIYCCEL